MIKLIIFDLDGTLIDSSRDILDAANATLKFYKIPPLNLEKIKEHIGEGFGPFMRHAAGLPPKGIHGDTDDERLQIDEAFKKFQFFYDQQLLKHTGFYAGVEAFLSLCLLDERKKIGVISNKPEYQVRLILKGLGVSAAQLVETYGGDTFEVKKPHPKPLQEMMKLAGAKPQETVMIGDSKADVDAAKNAGTHFIGVSFGFNSLERLKSFGVEHVIDHFDELHKKIQILID